MKKVTIAAFALAASLSQATLIIGNYPPTNDTNTSADINNLRMKALGFIMPSSDYILDSVKIRLLFTAAGLAAVPVVNIRAAGIATAPGAVLFSMSDPGGHTEGAGDYLFVAGSQFTLQANQKYWISVEGTTAQTGMSFRGSSPAITPTGLATHEGSLFTANAGTSWANSATLNTYEIQGTLVPEPATAAILGLGLAAAAIRRRVKK